MASPTVVASKSAIDGLRTVPTAVTLGALGVVYGDIGTSPLYALKEAVKAASAGGASWDFCRCCLGGGVPKMPRRFVLRPRISLDSTKPFRAWLSGSRTAVRLASTAGFRASSVTNSYLPARGCAEMRCFPGSRSPIGRTHNDRKQRNSWNHRACN